MRDTTIMAMMSPAALRALALYYESTAEILRRRADIFDPPPPPNRQSAMQIFLRLPDFVAQMQQAGHGLDSAIDLVALKTGSTRARVEMALKDRARRDKAAETDLRIQQAKAMMAAGATIKDIAKALGCTERHARRLSALYDPIQAEGGPGD